jgi:hypothetical protein
VIGYILAAGALAVAALWWLTRSKVGAHESALISSCRNDSAQAERLLEHERRRVSGLTREQAAERALRTLRRDL